MEGSGGAGMGSQWWEVGGPGCGELVGSVDRLVLGRGLEGEGSFGSWKWFS